MRGRNKKCITTSYKKNLTLSTFFMPVVKARWIGFDDDDSAWEKSMT